jgi:hypothetical protein
MVSSRDSLLSFTPLCKRTGVLLQKKNVRDLTLINLSLPAHFKELQNHFEVYLRLMTFFKNGAQGSLSSSFSIISAEHLPTQ